MELTKHKKCLSLLKLKNKLEADLNTKFNSVLINYYRDGRDHMSWHADDEMN